MDIVLGVSLTPKTVRMVLVEGEKGDGAIVDHDDFDVSSADGSATSSAAADQVVAAVLGTQESAAEGGHILKAIGVTWSDRIEAAALRDTLADRGIRDVMLVSELHAAGALAQAAGRAVGYESTGLLFIDRDTATLSVVRSDDGSIVKVLSRSLHSTDAMAVLADMVAAVEAQEARPQGMFVVGSGVDIASVKSHLADLVAIPVSAPEESGLALARGAALAAANAPAFDATTAGLAYALDPDGTTAGNESVGLANANTQMAPADAPAAVAWADDPDVGHDLDFADAAARRGGPQAVPARRQRADLDLRHRRCRPCHFARGQHPADGRPAAGSRPERDHPERRTAGPRPGRRAGAARASAAARRDHQGADTGGAGGSGSGRAAADGVRGSA